jgi:GNAT superfamily N-acetyltransferase
MGDVRTATAADLDLILQHRDRMFAEMGLPLDPATREAGRAFFSHALAHGLYYGWFAEQDGEVVAGGGIILLRYQPGPSQRGEFRPFVVNVWTDPGHRRRSLARQLMERMIEWSRDQGYSNLFLHASEAGRALYQELGFQPTNEMRLRLHE